jgi:hypothetical protein
LAFPFTFPSVFSRISEAFCLFLACFLLCAFERFLWLFEGNGPLTWQLQCPFTAAFQSTFWGFCKLDDAGISKGRVWQQDWQPGLKSLRKGVHFPAKRLLLSFH